MNAHKKLTLHPVGFATSFLTAALSMVVHDPSKSEVFKGISVLAFSLGVLSLYNEGRLKKSFQKSFNNLSRLFCSFWSDKCDSNSEGPTSLLNLDHEDRAYSQPRR